MCLNVCKCVHFEESVVKRRRQLSYLDDFDFSLYKSRVPNVLSNVTQ
jgi:hypothetical protein